MSELKPCPFCGAKLELKKDDDGNFLEHEDLANTPCIISTLCVELDMVEFWNKRAPVEGEKSEMRYLPACTEAETLHEILDESCTSSDSIDRECSSCDNSECAVSGEPVKISIRYRIERDEV